MVVTSPEDDMSVLRSILLVLAFLIAVASGALWVVSRGSGKILYCDRRLADEVHLLFIEAQPRFPTGPSISVYPDLFVLANDGDLLIYRVAVNVMTLPPDYPTLPPPSPLYTIMGSRRTTIPLLPTSIVFLLIFMGALAAPLVRRTHRRRTNRCVHCGYSLVGNISGRCPECGLPAACSDPPSEDAPGDES
jgi:hypothetical protein